MPSNALLYLHAITALHPGSGTALGVVDMPVQRERHTGWPLIPGSSIKGVLRDACRRRNADDPRLEAAFGKGGDKDSYAGAVSITDARILAFPVRSLKGVFAWVTCPQVLRRYHRDASIAAVEVRLPELPAGEGKALAAKQTPLRTSRGEIVLEEFVFQHLDTQLDCCPVLSAADQARVTILDDTDFSYFVKNATEITARIRLSHETKTVEEGALFYQEFLPAETLMYSLVLGCESRGPGQGWSAEEMAGYVFGQLPEYIQIGGDETTGKGICRLVKGGA